jgi:DNA-binding CsgD family transcriptional regulator
MPRKTTKQQAKDLKEAVATADKLAPLPPGIVVAGLTDQQKAVVQLKLRGFNQSSIAGVLKVSQARVSQEMAEIKQHFHERGSSIDQKELIGESITIFEEVEKEAWKLYHKLEDDKKLKALDTVMTSREKQVKLLMEVGLIKREISVSEVKITVPDYIQRINDPEQRRLIANSFVALPAGTDPEPPDEGIIDVEPE